MDNTRPKAMNWLKRLFCKHGPWQFVMIIHKRYRYYYVYRCRKCGKKHKDFLDWDVPEEKEEDIHICENEGCSHKGFACRLPGEYNEETKEFEEDSIEYLCCEHAEEQGYCIGCGEFIAGTGMEYRNNGYCDNCYDEIKSSEVDDEDEEDFPYGSLDY